MIVRANYISECGETFVNALNTDRIRERVAEVLEFLVGRGGGNEESATVTGGEATDDTGSSDGGVDDRDDVLELGLEDGVKVHGAAGGDEGVGVCEGREDSDFVRVFELGRGEGESQRSSVDGGG